MSRRGVGDSIIAHREVARGNRNELAERFHVCRFKEALPLSALIF
jgi:hypothetical protein